MNIDEMLIQTACAGVRALRAWQGGVLESGNDIRSILLAKLGESFECGHDAKTFHCFEPCA